jgi:hypothetical protein
MDIILVFYEMEQFMKYYAIKINDSILHMAIHWSILSSM